MYGFVGRRVGPHGHESNEEETKSKSSVSPATVKILSGVSPSVIRASAETRPRAWRGRTRRGQRHYILESVSVSESTHGRVARVCIWY